MKKRNLIFVAPIGIAALALFITLGGVVVEQLWNWVVPAVFGWKTITLWQAIGLLALSRILFGNWGGHGAGPKFAQRMSPEERARFREGIRRRFGLGGGSGEATQF